MSVLSFSDVLEEAENSSAERSRNALRNSLSGAGARSFVVESNEDNRFSSDFSLCAFIVISPTNPALSVQSF